MKKQHAFICLASLMMLTAVLFTGCEKSVENQTPETSIAVEETRLETVTESTQELNTVETAPTETEVPIVVESTEPMSTESNESAEETQYEITTEPETAEEQSTIPNETEAIITEPEITIPVMTEEVTEATEESTPPVTEAVEETATPTTEAVEETAPPATEEPPATVPSVTLDYGAAMAYGNAYAASAYGCVYKPELDWYADGTGYDFGGDYFLDSILRNGGQDMLNRLMADKVDATFGAWRFPDGCAGMGVECICYEEDGVVWFYVFYG